RRPTAVSDPVAESSARLRDSPAGPWWSTPIITFKPAQAEETRADYPVMVSPRVRVLAFLDELLAADSLMEEYAAMFAGRHEVELVVAAPGFAGAEARLERELARFARAVVTSAPVDGRTLDTIVAVYTKISRNGALSSTP